MIELIGLQIDACVSDLDTVLGLTTLSSAKIGSVGSNVSFVPFNSYSKLTLFLYNLVMATNIGVLDYRSVIPFLSQVLAMIRYFEQTQE